MPSFLTSIVVFVTSDRSSIVQATKSGKAIDGRVTKTRLEAQTRRMAVGLKPGTAKIFFLAKYL